MQINFGLLFCCCCCFKRLHHPPVPLSGFVDGTDAVSDKIPPTFCFPLNFAFVRRYLAWGYAGMRFVYVFVFMLVERNFTLYAHNTNKTSFN